VQTLFLGEAAMIGLIASVLGIAAGVCLAMVLTWVVNKAFFGWTIALRLPHALLAATPIWIIAAALVAAWIPATRASRVRITEAVRME
jgi:putative ABC transport system permease protein